MSRIEKIKIEQAIGKPLAHDVTLVDMEKGFKGPLFKRGYIIQKGDVEKFKRLGKEHVYTIDLSPDEIHEDDAAVELAESLMGEGTYRDKQPSEGKINIYSSFKGLTKVDREKLLQFNLLKIPSCPTLPSNKIVEKGQKIASVRILGLFTSRKIIERAKEIARGGIVSVKPFLEKNTGIITTGNEVFYGRIKDTFTPLLKRKIKSICNCNVIHTAKAPDKKEVIEMEIEKFIKLGCEVILITGGTSVDPDDVTYLAIKDKVKTFFRGLPVQPGNYLSIGYVEKVVILGIPAGAIYSSRSSLDLILPRIATGEKPTEEEIYNLGYGGLL